MKKFLFIVMTVCVLSACSLRPIESGGLQSRYEASSNDGALTASKMISY